jgi:hypothetical protein
MKIENSRNIQMIDAWHIVTFFSLSALYSKNNCRRNARSVFNIEKSLNEDIKLLSTN